MLKKAAHNRETIGFTLSLAVRVTIVVRRAGRTYRADTVSGHAGRNTTQIGTRGLKKGRYAVTVTPTGGKATQASFTV